MSIRFGALTAVLASTAIAAAGCGGSDNSSSTSTAAPASSGTPASTTSSGGGSTASNPQVQAAVAACKSSIDNNPAVKANIKSDLEGICDKAASGDANAVKKATKEVCLKIVESSVPTGSAQDQAKAACNAA